MLALLASSMVDAILGRASIRHWAFFRGGQLIHIQTLFLKGGGVLIGYMRLLFESERLLDHLW